MWSAGDLPFAIAIVVLAVRWMTGYEVAERRAAELARAGREPRQRHLAPSWS